MFLEVTFLTCRENSSFRSPRTPSIYWIARCDASTRWSYIKYNRRSSAGLVSYILNINICHSTFMYLNTLYVLISHWGI